MDPETPNTLPALTEPPTPEPPIAGELIDPAGAERKLQHDRHLIRGKAMSLEKEQAAVVKDAISLMALDANNPEFSLDSRIKALRCIMEVSESGMRDIDKVAASHQQGPGPVVEALTDEEIDDLLEP